MAGLEKISTALMLELGLKGIFGFDFIRMPDNQCVLIDINPRFPATLELYPHRQALFDGHFVACLGSKVRLPANPGTLIGGHIILYASADWRVPQRFSWPSAVCDIPRGGSAIPSGAPLCSVKVYARDEPAVIGGLQDAIGELRAQVVSHAGAGVIPAELNIHKIGE